MILVSVGVVFGIAYWIFLQTSLTEAQKTALEWVKNGLGVIAFAGNVLVIRIAFKGLKREKIEEEIRKRVEKEYTK